MPSSTFDKDGALEGCRRCGGYGDLDSYRLMQAYELGRRDVLDHLAVVWADLRSLLVAGKDSLAEPTPPMTPDVLRRRVGQNRR